jgi:hypothetical protein
MFRRFGRLFIGGKSRKNNRDEIAEVFIRERFGSKIACGNRKEG